MTDYSIYLVTDSTMIPENCTFLAQIEQAVKNGATIVQLREKSKSTRDFLADARAVLAITRAHGVPLIINDRIDVALAIGADGVHVGQDDMPADKARELIGPHRILGVSCGSPAETAAVCAAGVADYVGLGTIYATQTKTTKPPGGPLNVRRSLELLKVYNDSHEKKISCVGIGGVNQSNVAKVRYQCGVPGQRLDGVAVVSCIMAAKDAASATKALVAGYHGKFGSDFSAGSSALSRFHARPLVHHIMNNVNKNFCANITLATGGSPIMSELHAEYDDFTSLDIPAGLVMNLGTPSAELMPVFLAGLASYNKNGKPVVLDPVAAGASGARQTACRVLLNAGQFAVIKGNLGEILALRQIKQNPVSLEGGEAKQEAATMQGVDSTVVLGEKEIVEIAAEVALEYRAVVVVSGATNYVVEARDSVNSPKVEIISGGHPVMASVTGTGCSLGSVIGSYVACASHAKHDIWGAVVDAVRFYNEAGSRAGSVAKGPGDFIGKFLDELASASAARDA